MYCCRWKTIFLLSHSCISNNTSNIHLKQMFLIYWLRFRHLQILYSRPALPYLLPISLITSQSVCAISVQLLRNVRKTFPPERDRQISIYIYIYSHMNKKKRLQTYRARILGEIWKTRMIAYIRILFKCVSRTDD